MVYILDNVVLKVGYEVVTGLTFHNFESFVVIQINEGTVLMI